MACEYSNPVNYLGETPIEGEIWNFKTLICERETIELIVNPETEAEFYISKSIDYGDVILICFLTLFTIFLIGKSIFNFFWGNG